MREKVRKIEVYPVYGVPKIKPGDDIAKHIASRFDFEDGDVLVICSTAVAKAEGRIKNLEEIKPSNVALEIARRTNNDPRVIQAALDESDEILIDKPFLLVRRKDGNICVNAGVDRSNVEEGKIVLPLTDADKIARKIRKRIEELTGKKVAVLITDSEGRCFRKGIVGFAVGCAGLKAFRSWIGEKDLYGNVLKKTVECIVDEIAAFANLIMGEGNYGIPAVIFRGLNMLNLLDDESCSLKDVLREEHKDLILQALREIRDCPDFI